MLQHFSDLSGLYMVWEDKVKTWV